MTSKNIYIALGLVFTGIVVYAIYDQKKKDKAKKAAADLAAQSELSQRKTMTDAIVKFLNKQIDDINSRSVQQIVPAGANSNTIQTVLQPVDEKSGYYKFINTLNAGVFSTDELKTIYDLILNENGQYVGTKTETELEKEYKQVVNKYHIFGDQPLSFTGKTPKWN